MVSSSGNAESNINAIVIVDGLKPTHPIKMNNERIIIKDQSGAINAHPAYCSALFRQTTFSPFMLCDIARYADGPTL
jgi:hypothetical protein